MLVLVQPEQLVPQHQQPELVPAPVTVVPVDLLRVKMCIMVPVVVPVTVPS